MRWARRFVWIVWPIAASLPKHHRGPDPANSHSKHDKPYDEGGQGESHVAKDPWARLISKQQDVAHCGWTQQYSQVSQHASTCLAGEPHEFDRYIVLLPAKLARCGLLG